VVIYRKYYGRSFALRITALMFVTMALAALVVEGVFSIVGLIPSGARPTRTAIFGSLAVNYKLVLNIVALLAFAALFWLTARRGSTDPSCGMKVDRHRALIASFDGHTFHFCSEQCLAHFKARHEASAEAPELELSSRRN
jgi:YHS domain-containing protein